MTSFDTRAIPRVIFFIKNILKNKNWKILDFSAKLYPRILGGCNVWPKSNIYNINNKIKLTWPSNTRPKNIGCGPGYKVV